MTPAGSETNAYASPVFRIHEDFYFSDGNIVLDVVEDNQIMRFRVHRSILSRNSPFFAGMFEIPQPPELASELADGCPVINLTGDFVSDWIIILGALYNVFFNQTQQPVSTVIAMLRLGIKYQFPPLEHNAQYRLRQWYPSTLKDFRSRGQASSCPFEVNNSVQLLQVADEGIIPDDVLPVLYSDHLHLLNQLNDHSRREIMPFVNEKMKLRLLVGHHRLLAAQYKYTFACLRTLRFRCRDPLSCTNVLKQAQEFLLTPDPSGNIDVHLFMTLAAFKFKPFTYFCNDCASVVTAGLESGAAEIWRLLPWAFGLGSWEELIENDRDKERDQECNEGTNDQ